MTPTPIERPILFSSPMVRAILAGTKTQTRRVVKPQPVYVNKALFWESNRYDNGDGANYLHTGEEAALRLMCSACPHGAPGNRLWVRETWQEVCGAFYYLATDELDHGAVLSDWPWRPSIHMPRWACRLVLEIESVRVERVQEITEEDAAAEGYQPLGVTRNADEARTWFRALWDSINAKRGCGWDADPYVWCITFNVAEADR